MTSECDPNFSLKRVVKKLLKHATTIREQHALVEHNMICARVCRKKQDEAKVVPFLGDSRMNGRCYLCRLQPNYDFSSSYVARCVRSSIIDSESPHCLSCFWVVPCLFLCGHQGDSK